MAHVLIADKDLGPALARRYLELGYRPVVNTHRKSWSAKPGITGPVNQHVGFFSDDDTVAEFENNPFCGIGILGNYFNDGTTGLLFIDVDIPDPEEAAPAMQVIADIIGTPCPVKHGSKGGTFFVRYPSAEPLSEILNSRGLSGAQFATKCKLKLKHLTNAGIDFIGSGAANNYTVVPPTMHEKPNPDGSPRFYKWVPFPGTKITLDLSDTPPHDLPSLDPYHMLLIYQYAKNPTSPIFRYIGQTAAGDHHQAMLNASLYMYHEKFTLEEITAICLAEAERTAPDDATYRERQREIKTAVAALPAKVPEQKPAKTGNSGSKSASKVPLDRLMYDWLVAKFPVDDLAYFSGVGYRWDGNSWIMIKDVRLENPWRPISSLLIDHFDMAGNAAIQAAVRLFKDNIPERTASPDPTLIAFQNGILDTKDFTMRREERDDYIPVRIPYDYDPNARSEVWQQFLKHLVKPPLDYIDSEEYDEDWKKAYCLVEEFLGYCLVRSHRFEKMLFLIGRPGTGKSTLFKALGSILPKGFVSNVAVEEFGDPNAFISMASANLNVAAEAENRNKNSDRLLLNICSGEHVKLKVLYEDVKMVELPTRLLFHGNNTPDTYDSTGAIERRSLIVRTTDEKIADTDKQVMDFHALLVAEAPGILAGLARAYRRLLDRGRFDIPSYSKAAAHSMTIDANSVSRWIDECCYTVEDLQDGMPGPDLYEHYKEWAEANGFRPVFHVITWGKKLTSMGFPSRNKKLPGGNVAKYRQLKLKTNIRGGAGY